MHTQLKHNIKQKLSLHSMSVSELERRAGLKQSTVQNILHGRSKNPGVETMRSIAQELHCSIDALISDTHEPAHPISVHEDIAWNAPLFIQAIETIQALLDKKQKTLPKKQILACVEEVYKYSIGISNTIDERFATWIIEKLL